MGYSAVREAVAEALDAKRELTKLQRQLSLFERAESKKMHKEKQRATVAAIRADLDRRVGRDLVTRINESGVPVASDAEVKALAEMMNRALHMVGDAEGCHAWFVLFRAIDDDHSGRISYLELKRAVRQILCLSEKVLSEKRLQSIWRALDTDSSGAIEAGEVSQRAALSRPGSPPPRLSATPACSEEACAAP